MLPLSTSHQRRRHRRQQLVLSAPSSLPGAALYNCGDGDELTTRRHIKERRRLASRNCCRSWVPWHRRQQNHGEGVGGESVLRHCFFACTKASAAHHAGKGKRKGKRNETKNKRSRAPTRPGGSSGGAVLERLDEAEQRGGLPRPGVAAVSGSAAVRAHGDRGGDDPKRRPPAR